MKAVIFDIDGTLVDSVDLHAKAWQEAFAQFGVQVSFQEARSQIGKGGDQLLPTFLTRQQQDEFGEELEEWRGDHFRRHYISKVHPFRNAHELLARTKDSGKLIAAGSSAKQDELDYYLQILAAKDLFDAQTNADDVDKSKPHPDIFEVALKKLKVAPDETLVVGDSPYDAEAAGRAGIATIALRCGGFPLESLLAAGAIETYENPADLLWRFNSSGIMRSAKVH